MKIKIANLGLIDEAEIHVKDLTIVCGENNTGKTYVTYALYGFLKLWRRLAERTIQKALFANKRGSDTYQFDLSEIFNGKINHFFSEMSEGYKQFLPNVFATNKANFENSVFEISFDDEIPFLDAEYSNSISEGSAGKVIATIKKEKGSSVVNVLFSADSEIANKRRLDSIIIDFVTDAACDIVFSNYMPSVFIASAERTGAAIFRKELDFARARMIEALSSLSDKEIKNPLKLIQSMNVGYSLPIQNNVDFVRQIETLDSSVSPLSESFPELLDSFDDIIGGKYKVIKNSLYYIPKGSQKTRFSMAESSSCVRALLDISFYIKSTASIGDFLIIDEPELNLHPNNQRLFARFICQLVNCGVKVFVTTHSDYLVKEINSLIMLSASNEDVRKSVIDKYGYKNSQLIKSDKINLVMTKTLPGRKKLKTLVPAKIHKSLGIEVGTFDHAINEMNEIQSEIMCSADIDSDFFS
ncbi:ATP-binding protein [Salmonella enterica subsp. enterica]|nr:MULTISPECIES: AAA family ATPase [Citrobacter]EDW6139397.1 ATP-binding protein [Salmonella enterica subsp. enterica]EME9756615.1 AAA family ATPase [Serratia marcescens]HBC0359442.1 AAA family ATPase [Citrobacter farmeri]MDE9681461.1 ATP-binding protein [Citrobacter portucalensis]MDM2782674.1 ATP-binding protein [Citrobacter sp. Cpo137]